MKSLALRVVMTLLVLLGALPAWAEGDATAEGLGALKQGEYEKAYGLFLRAVEESKTGDKKRETANLLFYLGLARQELAGRDAERRDGLLAEAATYYNQALGLNPKSSSTLNNLAQVYRLQDATNLARKTLTAAIALGDEKQAFYMQNYADLALAEGDWKTAARFYALALWKEPENAELARKLVEVCLKNDRALLGAYLWDMNERGQVLQAQKIALSVFREADWTPREKEELLAIIASALSRQTYAPKDFLGGETSRALAGLSEDSTVGPGAREVLQLHEGERLLPRDYSWWSRKTEPFANPPRGKWPLQAFQDLIRSLGEYYKTAQQIEPAEKYLRLAIDIHEFMPDLDSFISLADLYARLDRKGALRALINAKEDVLFGGKARAYREAKLDEIYAFHRALGSIYSHLGQWGRSSEPNSAIFQLEHALEIAEEARRRPPAKPVEVEPALVDRLATAYQKTDQPAKAFQVRLETAESLKKAGNEDAAMAVFLPIQSVAPPREFKVRYEALKTQVKEHDTGAGDGRLDLRRIRVSHTARAMDNQQQEEKLTDGEVEQIRKSLGAVYEKQRRGDSLVKTVDVLPASEGQNRVKEIDLEGGRGRVLLEKGSKTVEVPFAIESATAKKAASARYIKP